MSGVTTKLPMKFKLFTARACAYALRADLALHEVKADVERVEIDLNAKPEWYTTKVNTAGKVPLLQLGMDDEANIKIPESLVILEFIADLYQTSAHSIYPPDAYARAEARGFIERFNQIVWLPYCPIFVKRDPQNAPAVLKGFEEIVQLLSRHEGPFLLGEGFTFADIGVSPFIGLILLWGKRGLVKDGGIYETLTSDAKFKPLIDYADTIHSRPSWKALFNEEEAVEVFKRTFGDTA